MDPVGMTSLYTAMLRARESARPDRLFTDPFAETLAGQQGSDVLAWMETHSPGAAQNPVVPIRTRFYDDTLKHVIDDYGMDQFVILAAGLDTRAFRLPLPPELALFELDQREVLDFKASRLAELNAAPRCRRVPIPTDLTGDWSAALQDGGFDRERPAIWLAEGLLPYLDDAQVHQLLGMLSKLAAAGSWLLVDVMSTAFLTSPQLASFLTMMAKHGSPLHSSTDDPEGLVARHGWQPQVTCYGAPEANFGRWVLPAGYRDDPDCPHGYLIVAQR
jgi:methyltransferase (TIGR00027 family)